MLKRLLPHVSAVLIFALLTTIYFLPYYQGKTLSQGDVTQWEGMSKEIADWNQVHPSDPALWTNAMFGGMPAVQISLSFTGNFVSKVFQAVGVVFPYSSSYMFMMFIGFYIFLLCLEVDPWLAIAGSIAYGLSSFTIISIEAGHNTKVQAMSLMAPVLGGVVLAYRKNILLGAAITALFLSMTIDANHIQIAYYILMILAVLAFAFFVESIFKKQILRFFKASFVLLIAGTLALLPNVANLWGTQEYAKETIRGGSSELTQKKKSTDGGLDLDYASRWSYGLGDGEILSLIIPDIKGGGSGNDVGNDNSLVQKIAQNGNYPIDQVKHYVASILYWGNQPFTSGPVYFGAAIVFLFIFSLLIIQSRFTAVYIPFVFVYFSSSRRKMQESGAEHDKKYNFGALKGALVTLIILSIFLAAGHNTPFFKLAFNTFPFFNKFRNPSMALVIAQLAIPLMAILGLSVLFTTELSKEELLKKLKIAGGITAGIVIVFGLLGSYMYSFSGPADAELAKNGGEMVSLLRVERASMLRGDSIRSLFFIAMAFALVWFYIKKTLTQPVLIAGLAVLFLADGWLVAKRYLETDNFVEAIANQNAHYQTPADLEISRENAMNPNPIDTLDFRVFNVTRDPFNDAMTSYYHKSVGGYHPAKLIRYQDLIENQISKNNINVLRMLNTRYVITEGQNKEPRAVRLDSVCGNAWFVRNITWAKNADEEMADLSSFNPHTTAVVDERYKKDVSESAIGSDSGAMIKLKDYTPNKLTYAYTSPTSQVAVFSEIYYDDNKGWNAYLDNNKVPHFRADYVLRAMALPAGTHQIEFRFEPKSVVVGNKIAYAGSFFLFLFVFGSLGFAGYRKFQEIEAEPQPAPKPVVKPTVSKTVKKK